LRKARPPIGSVKTLRETERKTERKRKKQTEKTKPLSINGLRHFFPFFRLISASPHKVVSVSSSKSWDKEGKRKTYPHPEEPDSCPQTTCRPSLKE